MAKNKRLMWIKAYKDTLDQLERDEYVRRVSTCIKCIVVGRCSYNRKCGECPETIHSVISSYPCVSRKTVSYTSNDRFDNKLSIEYHKKAIEFLENMSRYDKKKFQQYLLKIDKEIYEELTKT